jgi:hypothetical protein
MPGDRDPLDAGRSGLGAHETGRPANASDESRPAGPGQSGFRPRGNGLGSADNGFGTGPTSGTEPAKTEPAARATVTPPAPGLGATTPTTSDQTLGARLGSSRGPSGTTHGTDPLNPGTRASDPLASGVHSADPLSAASRGSNSRGTDSRGTDSRGTDSRGSDSRGSDSRGSGPLDSDALASGTPRFGKAASESPDSGLPRSGDPDPGALKSGALDAGSRGIDPLSPGSRGTGTLGSDPRGTDALSSNSRGTEPLGPGSLGSGSLGTGSLGTGSLGSGSLGTEAGGSGAPGTESSSAGTPGAEPLGRGSRGIESFGSGTRGPEPLDPGSRASDSLGSGLPEADSLSSGRRSTDPLKGRPTSDPLSSGSAGTATPNPASASASISTGAVLGSGMTASPAVDGNSIGGPRVREDDDRTPRTPAPRRSASLEDAEPARRGRRAAADDEAHDDGPLRPGDVAEGQIAFWDDDAVRHFRAAWHEVKAEFVDDPVTALTRAHDLLTDAVNELTEALLAERDELDPLRGSATPDTESMRMAMRGYREFLERILAL